MDRNILMVMEEFTFLSSALTEQLEVNEFQVVGMEFDMKKLSEHDLSETEAIVLVFKDVIDITKELIYIRDVSDEKQIPIFTVFTKDPIKLIFNFDIMAGTYNRPIMVKEVANDIRNYLDSHDKSQKKHILLVDDSGIMLRVIKGWLGDKYQVTLANSGAMAMKHLATHRPDLVLLDYEMPIVNGGQVLGMMRTEMDFADIPVIFLTGKSDRSIIMEVQKYKIQGYILKSESPETIKQQIDDFFKKS